MSASLASTPVETADGPTVELPLIVRLCNLLDDAEIAYCHWKSNVAIGRSASGLNDLDLLVRRADGRRLTELLSSLGFVRAGKRRGAVPGIESFYGYDCEADRLIHVHVHYQLILGDDRTKNYRLPIEDAYIRSAVRPGLFRLPSPEHEYVVLVIRMVLKYCTWDEIAWNALRARRATPKRSERDELKHLSDRIDPQRVTRIVEDLLPYVGVALFARCVASTTSRASAWDRVRTARRLELALQPHARHSRRVDRALRISRRVVEAIRHRTGGIQRNRVAGGGALIGIMGGDGSGKSTAIATLQGWLASEFDVRVVHLGKPPWSATTYAVRGALKVLTAVAGIAARILPIAPTRRLAALASAYRPLFWLLCTARDRRREYGRARRVAIDGGLVLCDRYPHALLRVMEAPLIADRAGERSDRRLVRAMARLEERYHRVIAAPEVLAVLIVDPEVAVHRKTTETAESVRARGEAIGRIDWRGAGVPVVDASQPADVVARELKALVWSTLS